MAGFVFVPSRKAGGRGELLSLAFLWRNGRRLRPVDGIDGERFQLQIVLLGICKVDRNPVDVQWNGWLFDDL
jgi:hypothetical protein